MADFTPEAPDAAGSRDSATSARSNAAQLAAARRGLTVVFVVHAALVAAWSLHIPEVKHSIGLTDSQLGVALAGAPIASIGVMLWTGGLIARRPSKVVLRGLLVAYCLTPALPTLAPSMLTLLLAMAVWGGLGGGMNVAMNAEGVGIERSYGRPILASLAAAWSFGAFLGVAVGTLAAASPLPVPLRLAVIGLLALSCGLPATRTLIPATSDATSTGLRLARPNRALLALGTLAFCSLLSEGAAEAWSAVFLTDSLGIKPALAGLGYGAYSLGMFVGRVLGDRVVTRLGPVRTVRLSGVVAATGFGAGIAVGHPASAVVGFGLFGLGLSGVIPIVFRASGRVPDTLTGPSLAAVSSSGWIGLVCGPPLLGAIAGATSLTVALLALPILSMVIVALASAVREGT